MENLKFSIIIPVYNQAKFIGETIKSVLDQTYSNYELIIVNDGSTDNSKGIVSSFKDPHIHYLELERNKGEQAARNAGIRASEGDLIAHLDADDLFHPQIERLQKLGLLEWTGTQSDVLRLTQRGRLLGNQVFVEFI